MYNERIILKAKATFTWLIISTSGGMAPECEMINKRLALMISEIGVKYIALPSSISEQENVLHY